jgi:membrane protein implicated in regulation of membrane protease activity
MALDATARRRWLGAATLLAALAMLICGETVLKGRLGDLGFLAYWLVCLVLTGLAVVVAFLDVRALGRRTRQEQRDLFEKTLRQIETEARAKSRQNDRNPRKS